VSSNRYGYWRIGGGAFVHHPLDGLGSSGFRVYWLRERPIRESVRNVHSLELETAAELGIVGLLALGAMLGGVGWAAGERCGGQSRIAGPHRRSGGVARARFDRWDWQLRRSRSRPWCSQGAHHGGGQRRGDLAVPVLFASYSGLISVAPNGCCSTRPVRWMKPPTLACPEGTARRARSGAGGTRHRCWPRSFERPLDARRQHAAMLPRRERARRAVPQGKRAWALIQRTGRVEQQPFGATE